MDWQTFREASAQEDSTLDEQWRRLMSRRGSIEERGLAALEFMAALDGRIDQRADLAAEIDRSFSPSGGARSIRSELHWFNAHQDKSLAELAADYVIQRVTCRHTWVATQKLRRQRDYTFLFEARDGRLAYRAQYDPVTTTPRLEPAIQFLVDIRLIDGNGLTVRGTTLIMEQP
jgi:hypothetical protein